MSGDMVIKDANKDCVECYGCMSAGLCITI